LCYGRVFEDPPGDDLPAGVVLNRYKPFTKPWIDLLHLAPVQMPQRHGVFALVPDPPAPLLFARLSAYPCGVVRDPWVVFFLDEVFQYDCADMVLVPGLQDALPVLGRAFCRVCPVCGGWASVRWICRGPVIGSGSVGICSGPTAVGVFCADLVDPGDISVGHPALPALLLAPHHPPDL